MEDRKYIQYAVDILKTVSKNSTCSFYEVGAVIMKEGRIVSTGWNGVPSRRLECKEAQKIIDFYKELKRLNIIKQSKDFDLKFLERKDLPVNIYVEFLEVKDIYDKYYGIDKNLEVLIENLKNDITDNFIHSRYEIHAEQNAISFAAKNGLSLKDCEIFVNYLPCLECAKIIIQSGIKAVYYLNDYVDKRFNISSEEFLKENGVDVIFIKERS